MRLWLRTLIVVLGLAIIAAPVAQVVIEGSAHAAILEHHDGAQRGGSHHDGCDPANILPAVMTVCCSSASLPVSSSTECVANARSILWRLSPILEPAGRSPALDPQPPRL